VQRHKVPVRGLPFILLVAFLLVPAAAGQEEGEGQGEDDEGEGGEALGFAALVALVAVGATALLNLARRRWLLPLLKGNKEALVRTMRLHRKVWLPVHLVTGVATVVLGTLHGLAEEEGNWMLWASMASFGFLTAGGAILAWKWTPATIRKGVYLLHTQQLLFIATLVLLWVGHAVGED
jgi:hypothetical protein